MVTEGINILHQGRATVGHGSVPTSTATTQSPHGIVFFYVFVCESVMSCLLENFFVYTNLLFLHLMFVIVCSMLLLQW